MASGALSDAEAFRQALAVDPHDPGATRVLALAAEKDGDLTLAAQLAHRFIEANPISHEGYALLGRVLSDPPLAAAYAALGRRMQFCASDVTFGSVDDVAAEVAGRGVGLAILDLGCGPGDLAAMLSLRLPEARIGGLDIAPAMVEQARRRSPRSDRLSFEVGDVARLAFESGSIDVVVSSLSLHHWQDSGAAFAEIARVLRPGGTALVYDLDPLTLEPDRLPDVARRAGLQACAGWRLSPRRTAHQPARAPLHSPTGIAARSTPSRRRPRA